ncbi:Hypothetical predicted protein [Pelobates cultripes]|uniref:Uncharacterized protein n=1 Tax=Pelobates cultripes TaxID=61616 RepID=A0AAD1SHH1_PELCU|nr:Hypothetical predicted protein [Pelobates cultripes]
MADGVGEHTEPTWETKFNAAFDEICAAFWSRIAARAEQTLPPITHTAQLQMEALSATSSTELTSPAMHMDDAAVSATCPSSELGTHMEVLL